MKLVYSPPSPFVRKVTTLIHHADLNDRIELINVKTTALSVAEEARAANPLGKIPVMILGDGKAIFDSRVITRYLDEFAGSNLYPQEKIYGQCKKRGICCQNVAVGVSKHINNSRILMHLINAWYRITYNFNLKGWYPDDQMLIYSCNYLKNGKCSIYWRRPLICRQYPRSKRIGHTTMPGYSLKPQKKL